MSKCSFDEVTKEELLDSIRELSVALVYAIDFIHCFDFADDMNYAKILAEHGYDVYSSTYDLPE